MHLEFDTIVPIQMIFQIMEYMIHVCNEREWYVKDYLVPSIVKQGIKKKDIILWHDRKSIGNLESFINSCKWIKEKKNPEDAIWHLQDDVVLASNFKDVTEKPYDGFVCGFCNDIFDGERTNYIGSVPTAFMWFSFPCIRIPNDVIGYFYDWYVNECVPNHLYDEYVETGRCDDSIFRFYILDNEQKSPALNMYPNIVDHIDYLIGGTVINKQRKGKFRKAYWRSGALDEAVAELEKKLKNHNSGK